MTNDPIGSGTASRPPGIRLAERGWRQIHAVVIQGRPEHREPGKTDVTTMDPGSYLGSNGRPVHQISCGAGADCIIYVRTEGKVDVGVR
ncbi:MAG: DUF4437 domain-containing protein [Polyangiales bacterium]